MGVCQVDKTEMLEYTNKVMNTLQGYICNSRPRRFGKSITANMLTAYYSKGCDSQDLFAGLKISEASDFKKHLNQYDVLKINMQEFLSATNDIEHMLKMLNEYLIFDLKEQYGQVRFRDEKNLVQVMKDVYSYTKHPFVILIDEWDCLFREYSRTRRHRKNILIFLDSGLKTKSMLRWPI